MFWRFGFANASAIDTLLDREDVALEALLDEDELLQECKAQNTRLIDYFQRRDVLIRLLGFVSGDIEPPEAGKFKYPYVATEVLCSEIWSIVETCLHEDGKLLKPFWEMVLNRSAEDMKTQVAMAVHFSKINGVFMSKKPHEMWAFIQAQPNIVERLLMHLECEPFLDLLVRILHDPAVPDITEWFSQERLIPRLVNMLSARHSPDMHAVVAELISRIISMAAPSPGSGVADGPGAQIGPSSNRFARQLAARESVQEMVGYILQDFPAVQQFGASNADSTASTGDESLSSIDAEVPEYPNVQSATSSVVHAIAVIVELIRKNNSDYFEPYLFHTIRNRLIQVQQQQPAQTEDGRKALEDAMQEMVDRMGVVHLGPLLDVMCENMEKLQGFLHKPRSLLGPVHTSVGAIAPLTTERYRICELFAELLHCSNMALLNRPAEYDKLYDSEGRLQGGLSAMEELAQVLAMKTGEQHDADAMDESEDELEPAGELPVSDRTQSVSDSDEEMSSDGDNSDEDMDDIAIDDPPAAHATETPDAAAEISSETPPAELVQSPTPQPPLSPSPSPSPGPARKNSDPANSPLSRPRSAHSRRSLRRSSRRESLLAGALPPGERLKQKFLDINLIPDVLNLFFDFPWNNFLHSVVYDLVHQILHGKADDGLNRDLIIALFRDARVMYRIVEGQQLNDEESAKPKGVRLGYMGHLTLMSEDIISTLTEYGSVLRIILNQTAPVPEWEEYVNGRFSETKQKDTSLLGGGKPVVASNPMRMGAQRFIDEADTSTPSALTSDGGETSGEFRRAKSSRPTRESSADFGPAPIPEDDEDENEGPPQFARYLAQEMQTSQLLDDEEDEEDEDSGWLARSTFRMQSQPTLSQPTLSRPTTHGFDDTFGEPTNAALQHSFDDPFVADDDDGFGPFSDSAANGDDPFSFSSTLSEDLDENDSFGDFGSFGDFQSADEGDGHLTPTAGSWSSLTSGDSSSTTSASLADSLEEFGPNHSVGANTAPTVPEHGDGGSDPGNTS